MKLFCKLLLFLVLVIFPDSIFCQETLSYLEGKLFFQRPSGVTLWEERQKIFNRDDYENYWQNRISLNVDVYNLETLKNEPPTLMSRPVYDLAYTKGYLDRNDLLRLFSSKSEFVIFDCTPRINIWKSYKRLSDKGTVIGETFFHAYALNLEARNNYGYSTSLIIDNQIVNIYLAVYMGKNFSKEMDRYFTIRNNTYYWKDDISVIAFYEQLSSDRYKELPLKLQQLREAYDCILRTLEINQDGYRKKIDIINPQHAFKETHITTINLPLRERNSTDAPTIITLPKGTNVQMISTEKWESKIDGITAHWAIVITSEGFAGWCFSGYLQEY
jgi:hypothetical protein